MTDEHGRHLWLMKAEPESRVIKGIDVAFSIDDLAAATRPEPWSGVRNAVANKNMKAMKVGDLAFFYHSNCQTPGIAGIMEIVEEAKPDEDAFDPAHPYYDAKSDRENPRWLCVSVEFRQKMPTYVNLQTLKEYKDDALADMQLFKNTRLSVSQVSRLSWDFIVGLCGADPIPPPTTKSTEHDSAPTTVRATTPKTKKPQPSKTSKFLSTVNNLFSPRKADRSTSVGPSTLQPQQSTPKRASSAQPMYDLTPGGRSATLTAIDEDPIQGAVPPTFTMRSSPPIAEAAGSDPAMPVNHMNTMIDDVSGPLDALVEGLTDTVDGAVEALAGAVSGGEEEVEESFEVDDVDEAMEQYQGEMETTIM
jgi:predicted RNA-binding protein with PUA-like domain